MKTRIFFLGLSIFFLASQGSAQDQQPDTLENQEQIAETEQSSSDLDGESLFKTHCKSCHHPTQRLVGPALMNVKDRRDSAWIVNFVLNSQSMIEAGDSIANALFMEFNQVPMPDHTHLKVDEIDAIIDYVNNPKPNASNSDNKISRPDVAASINIKPLQFNSFSFWLIYTATVFMIMGWLYYMVEYTEIVKRSQKNREEDNTDVPFGEQ